MERSWLQGRQQGTLWADGVGQGQTWAALSVKARSSQLLTTPTRFLVPQPGAARGSNTTHCTALVKVKHRTARGILMSNYYVN